MGLKGGLLIGLVLGVGLGTGAGVGILKALKKESSKDIYQTGGVEIKTLKENGRDLFNHLKSCVNGYKNK